MTWQRSLWSERSRPSEPSTTARLTSCRWLRLPAGGVPRVPPASASAPAPKGHRIGATEERGREASSRSRVVVRRLRRGRGISPLCLCLWCRGGFGSRSSERRPGCLLQLRLRVMRLSRLRVRRRAPPACVGLWPGRPGGHRGVSSMSGRRGRRGSPPLSTGSDARAQPARPRAGGERAACSPPGIPAAHDARRPKLGSSLERSPGRARVVLDLLACRVVRVAHRVPGQVVDPRRRARGAVEEFPRQRQGQVLIVSLVEDFVAETPQDLRPG